MKNFIDVFTKKKQVKKAKFLLEGHGCIDCEKCSYHWKLFGLNDKQTVICMIKEGTPEKGICDYWEAKIEWPRR